MKSSACSGTLTPLDFVNYSEVIFSSEERHFLGGVLNYAFYVIISFCFIHFRYVHMKRVPNFLTFPPMAQAAIATCPVHSLTAGGILEA